MYTPYISILMFLFLAWRFQRVFSRERKRQAAFTWPTTRVRLPKAPLDIKAGPKKEAGLLTKAFHFFYRGESTPGNILVHNRPRLSNEQRQLILTKLEAQRDQLRVHFNPDAPNESALQIGYPELRWSKTLFYIFAGIIVPTFLYFSYQSWLSAPAVWQDSIQFIPQ